ncbi:MAG: carboxypeptidase-like regulatory domain-containing protein [Bacteroidaceae bacterium]
MKKEKNHRAIQLLFSVAILFLSTLFQTLQAQNIRIQGKVTDENGNPIIGVNIKDKSNNLSVATTDDYGFYNTIISQTGVLVFSHVGHKEKTVNVNGRQRINIKLDTDVVQIDEVLIVSRVKNKVIPEPTDIEIKGNYFHLKTRVPVPKELFKSGTRLIIQPLIYNISTKKTVHLKPIVFDGKEYTRTQKRMYGFDLSQDPLASYIQTKVTSTRKSDMILYHDSLYIMKVNDAYRADVFISLENYNAILLADTFSIAQGTINPLRFLDYSFNTHSIEEKNYIPRPEMQLRDTNGEANITFKLGKAEIDNSNPNNIKELAKLNNELKSIEMDMDATLQRFEITGISSPEGGYRFNKRLSQRRTEKASQQILSSLNASTRKLIEVNATGEVAKWNDVADLLVKDSLIEQANKIKGLIKKYKNVDHLYYAIKRLPLYKLLKDKYLPQLRKVKYGYYYSVFRNLTDQEIVELHQKDYKKLTRYEFYRMMLQKDVDKEQICKEALECYPKFTYAANELAVIKIAKGEYDNNFLAPFVSKDAPNAIIYNQTITLLENGAYSTADSVLSLKPETETYFKDLRPFVEIYNGYYENYYKEVAATSPINEVVMLLAMKSNEAAWNKAKALKGTTGVENYLKAVAANRLDKTSEAYYYIEVAFELDPSLKEIAKIDGDVIDLLPEEQQIK